MHFFLSMRPFSRAAPRSSRLTSMESTPLAHLLQATSLKHFELDAASDMVSIQRSEA